MTAALAAQSGSTAAALQIAPILRGALCRDRKFILDVSAEADVERAFAEVVRAYGGVDVIVSNAGVSSFGTLDILPLADWERSFPVNTRGHFLVSRAAIRVMKQQGRGGSIVFNASKNVTAPGKEFGAYSASKAAESQLGRIVALEGASSAFAPTC